MSPIEFRAWLRGLLMGLAKGPVDEAVIRMIEENLPSGPATRSAEAPPPGYISPDQIRSLPRGVTKSVRRPIDELAQAPVDESPAEAVDGLDAEAPLPAPAPRAPAQRRKRRGHATPIGTDDNLKDALSGGEVLRLA